MNKDNFFYNYIHYASTMILLNILFIFYFKNIYSIFPLIFILFFFRNTQVNFTQNNKTLISPSSNKIKSIEKLENQYKITTYLSPLDHHFMVSPCDCQILDIIKNPQKDDAERVRITLKDNNNKIIYLEKVVKKLGLGPYLSKLLIDSRIKVNIKIGDKVKQGERIGMIRFGSEMVWYIPEEYQLIFKEGDYITIGQTIAKI